MRNTVKKRSAPTHCIRRCTYPNEADPGYFLNRIFQGILASFTVLGTVTVFLLMITL